MSTHEGIQPIIPEFVVDQWSLSFSHTNVDDAATNVAHLIDTGKVKAMGAMPSRFETAQNLDDVSRELGVPIEWAWGMLIGDFPDLIDQVVHSKRREDVLGVAMIAGGIGLQSERFKRYGDTKDLVIDYNLMRRNRGQGEPEMHGVIAHQSMISYLEKKGRLRQWIKGLHALDAWIYRTNGWSESLGRLNPLSWDPTRIGKHAQEHGYRTAFVTDVHFRTQPDLKKNNINPSGEFAIEQMKPHILYLADANEITGEEKLIPGDGLHEQELIDEIYAFLSCGGRTIALKVSPDSRYPDKPTVNVEKTLEWFYRRINSA